MARPTGDEGGTDVVRQALGAHPGGCGPDPGVGRAAVGAGRRRSIARELVIQPKLVGDLRYVRGSYETPQGTSRSSWTRSDQRFELKVTVPANTTAEVWVPSDGTEVHAPSRATFDRTEGSYAVYTVPAGELTFRSRTGSDETPIAG